MKRSKLSKVLWKRKFWIFPLDYFAKDIYWLIRTIHCCHSQIYSIQSFIRWCCMSGVCTTSFNNRKIELFESGLAHVFCIMRAPRMFRSSFSWQKNFPSRSECEITVGHRTCPTNLTQRPIEKRFLLLNGWTLSVENLFVLKPEESHENSIYLFIFWLKINNTTSLNLTTELFNSFIFFFFY